jgi:hypothetical protein
MVKGKCCVFLAAFFRTAFSLAAFFLRHFLSFPPKPSKPPKNKAPEYEYLDNDQVLRDTGMMEWKRGQIFLEMHF